MRNICIVTGARPNFVKVAPLVRALQQASKHGASVSYQLVYAGAENDPTLEQSLFDDLQMPRPDVFLGVDCASLNELTGRVMSAFEHYLDTHPTDVVIVVDDLASTMAVAIVTKKHGLRLAHLVAGTRSFDINMPKEINRLVIDGLSDLLFTAGVSSNSNARASVASARAMARRWRCPPETFVPPCVISASRPSSFDCTSSLTWAICRASSMRASSMPSAP